jgi:hypothetical protein
MFRWRKVVRDVIAVLFGTALVFGVMVVVVIRAWASSAPIHIANTGGEGVFIRSEPNKASTRLGWMGEGTSPDYHCFVWGENVNSVPIWFNVTHSGITGFYASYFDDSSYHSNEELTAKYGIPLCGAAPPPPPPQTPPPPPPAPNPSGGGSVDTGAVGSGPNPSPNAFYNRNAARQWAYAHAKDAQPFGTMCTWFVSRALWAGGFPQSALWNSTGPYRYIDHLGLVSTVPGTETAWSTSKFLDFVRRNFSVSPTLDITTNLHTNAVPQAEIGDLILYAWEKHRGDGITHIALVVNIARDHYPEVSEMGQYDFDTIHGIVNKIVHVHSTYVKRGWTWSVVHKVWLQKEKGNANMKAYLLHINGGHM